MIRAGSSPTGHERGNGMTPLKPGDGLVASDGPLLPLLVIVAVVVAGAVLLARLKNRRLRGGLAIVGFVLLLGYAALGQAGAIGFRGGASYVGPGTASDVDYYGVSTT